MNREECFFLGVIIKKYSFKGEVILKIDSDNPKNYVDIETFFIEEKGVLIPFFIEKSSMKNEFLRLKLENIDTEEKAESILKKKYSFL